VLYITHEVVDQHRLASVGQTIRSCFIVVVRLVQKMISVRRKEIAPYFGFMLIELYAHIVLSYCGQPYFCAQEFVFELSVDRLVYITRGDEFRLAAKYIIVIVHVDPVIMIHAPYWQQFASRGVLVSRHVFARHRSRW